MRLINAIALISGIFFPMLNYAAETSNGPAGAGGEKADKIKEILLNTKFNELDVNDEGVTSAAVRDTHSPQYKLGFKDGYKRAVHDVKQSFGEALTMPPSVLASGSSEQEHRTAQQWLDKSYSKLVVEKNWIEGIQAATVALSIDPDQASGYINRAWGYAEKGLLDEAIKDANRAIELSPRQALAYNNRAYAYELAGSITRAQQDYKIACEFNYKPACVTLTKMQSLPTPDLAAQVLQLLGQSDEKYRQKDWQAVEQISSQALILDPDNAAAFTHRAGARVELGRYSPALQDCNSAIKIDPNYGLAHSSCGHAYERKGELRQAVQSYQQACHLGVQQSCKDAQRVSSAN